MTAAPVLHLPDFELPFTIETDASDFGIGAVLLQNGHPLAYFSKSWGLGDVLHPPITRSYMLLSSRYTNGDNIYLGGSSLFVVTNGA